MKYVIQVLRELYWRKDMKKTLLITAVLLVILNAGYLAFRSPNETLPKDSQKESVGEFQKFQANFQSGNALGKRRASEADWAKVRAIAEKFSPQIADLERELFELKDGNEVYFSGGTTDKESEWAREQQRIVRGTFRLEKAIRDLEREQWAAMGEHLSAFELRKYRMENSFLGRNLREESAWFEPSEGEFLSLFVRQENKNNFLDKHFDGDLWEMNARLSAVSERRREILMDSSKPRKQRFAEVAALDDPEILLWREHAEVLKNVPPISRARANQYFFGRNRQDVAKAHTDWQNISEKRRMGQATIAEVNAAKERMAAAEFAETDDEMDAEIEIENADLIE